MPACSFLAVTADTRVCVPPAPLQPLRPGEELHPVCDNIIHCNGKDCDAPAWAVTSLHSSATGNKDTHSFFFFLIVLVIIDNWRKWMAENNYGEKRWSANPTGKCSGTSLRQRFQSITKILLFCSQAAPEITVVSTGSYTILCWQQRPPNMFLIQ